MINFDLHIIQNILMNNNKFVLAPVDLLKNILP